ncbi:MAG TPA: hypothetical protein GXZ76_04145 [Clostridiaceae bacterium]|nr:hypothetical protein [Clostridiaceae bacterium]
MKKINRNIKYRLLSFALTLLLILISSACDRKNENGSLSMIDSTDKTDPVIISNTTTPTNSNIITTTSSIITTTTPITATATSSNTTTPTSPIITTTSSAMTTATSPDTDIEIDLNAPADEPPLFNWACGSYSIMLYDEWFYDEESSGDMYDRFIPEGDDCQGIMIENLPIPLIDFSEVYQKYVDVWLEGDWATDSDLIFAGDAHYDAFPGALTLTYDIYNGSELIADMIIIAIQGNHADTFALIYWEEIEHDGMPSYYDQAMRIFESFTLLN